DATGELLFTHVGTYEAGLVVDDILGRPRARDYRVVPRVTFCDPEVASVGLTEAQAREAGHEVRTSVVPIAENERATIDGARLGGGDRLAYADRDPPDPNATDVHVRGRVPREDDPVAPRSRLHPRGHRGGGRLSGIGSPARRPLRDPRAERTVGADVRGVRPQ